jgi:hypothetical protein
LVTVRDGPNVTPALATEVDPIRAAARNGLLGSDSQEARHE